MIQCNLTPAACKRLIARGIVLHPLIQKALSIRRVVIVAGTTNGYVAEEILKTLKQEKEFKRSHFFRGVTLPPWRQTTTTGRLPDESHFPGDVVIEQGQWQPGKTVFDVIDQLEQGDIVLKGANALDVLGKKAAIFIGHPKGGTIGAIIPAVIGRRVHLLIPVGLEKRICGSLDEYILKVNTAQSTGPRMIQAPGEIFTELDALKYIAGVDAYLIGGGGVGGAEGSVWLAIEGSESQEALARKVIEEVQAERPFEI